ncbi:hypothetical protein CALVIDRAFT_335107 [Calocera viscosa TUFC12733]|uniref:Uncharacterized protein n=1 Tax=Calocera viscosa (strain TUFC12733) TaxID=1330018 RepID=A0A167HM75_CALVF|nr:hypothetical protein CALVIDRAFT_335107 [Calocera viscosa TUFC12733]
MRPRCALQGYGTHCSIQSSAQDFFGVMLQWYIRQAGLQEASTGQSKWRWRLVFSFDVSLSQLTGLATLPISSGAIVGRIDGSVPHVAASSTREGEHSSGSYSRPNGDGPPLVYCEVQLAGKLQNTAAFLQRQGPRRRRLVRLVDPPTNFQPPSAPRR